MFHPAYHKPGTCQKLFSWKLIVIEIRMQKAATRILITEVLLSSSSLLILMAPQVLCCIEIADQGKRLPLLPGQAGENYLRIMHCHNTPKIIKIVQDLYLFLPRANGFALRGASF